MDFEDQPIRKCTLTSIQALEDFLSLVDVSKFNKRLRDLLLHYLTHEYEELPPGFDYFLEDMQFLFTFLDKMEGEIPRCASE